MSEQEKNILESVSEDRRAFVERLIKSTAFVAPVALGLQAIATREVQAQQASESGGEGGAQESSAGGGSVSVPEPGMIGLMGLGLAGLALAKRRSNNQE